ncbi:MAG: hypothetical protein OXC91_00750 [Rhodobacteraceae bacterium]|nr:hypothetical protein [Paracoccaceae bacterium]
MTEGLVPDYGPSVEVLLRDFTGLLEDRGFDSVTLIDFDNGATDSVRHQYLVKADQSPCVLHRDQESGEPRIIVDGIEASDWYSNACGIEFETEEDRLIAFHHKVSALIGEFVLQIRPGAMDEEQLERWRNGHNALVEACRHFEGGEYED